MRWKTYLVLLAASTLFAACGDSGGGTEGGGGSGAEGGGGSGAEGGGGSTNPTTSSPTTSSSETSTLACGILYDERPDCQACMDDSCCFEQEACAPGTACGTLIDCAVACNMDDACIQGCFDENPQGVMDLQAVNACYTMNCEQDLACQYPICDSMLLYPDPTCASCLGDSTECCAAFTTCASDQTCLDCAGDPEGAGCDANANYQAVFSCFSEGDKCGKSCTATICDSGLGYNGFPACNYCLGQDSGMGGCCTEINACADDATCLACLTGETTGASCDNNALLTAFETCQMANCAADCGL